MIPNYATNHTTASILLVVFVASLIRSAFGFGEALIAIPLLSLFVPIEIAAPLAVLLSITIAAVVVVQDWRKIHISSAAWLLAPTFVGIPLGVALLTRVDQHFVKALLALVILAFSGYFLFRGNTPEVHNDSRAWLLGCGFLAGILGGAYGISSHQIHLAHWKSTLGMKGAAIGRSPSAHGAFSQPASGPWK
ncbi:MAG TPA: sulfite exporter TauE/SafE family protein [Candidatus Acidoferrales bacterium]|nr:sulfite exporter TauE/SafE family protein [Candidatus Acidoferrales bacterium]